MAELSQDKHGNLDQVKEVFPDVADIGQTALYLAAVENKQDVLEYFLNQGVHTEPSDADSGTTALVKASGPDQAKAVSAVIKPAAMTETKSTVDTPLTLACYRNRPDVVKVLLSAGADINETDNNGNTGLHKAAEQGHTAVVQCLLQRQPKITINNCNKTAIDLTEENNFPSIVAILKEYESKISILRMDKRVSRPSKRDRRQLRTYSEIIAAEVKDMKNVMSSNQSSDKLMNIDDIEQVVTKLKYKSEGWDSGFGNDSECNFGDESLSGAMGSFKGILDQINNVKDEMEKAEGILQTGSTVKDFSDKHLLRIAKKMGQDWKVVAGFLEVEFAQIVELVTKYESQPTFAGWHMLINWRDSISGDVDSKRELLKQALIDSDRHDLFEVL